MAYTPVDFRGYLSVPPGRRERGGEDVTCGIHIGVAGPAARDAGEDRLAFTGFSGGVPAGGASLRRVRRTYFDYLGTGTPCLAVQCESEGAPAFAEDGLVQPGFLSDVDAGLCDGAGSARGHVADTQVFYPDKGVVVAQPMGELPIEISSPVADALPHLRQLCTGLLGSVGGFAVCVVSAAVLPGSLPLQREHPPLLQPGIPYGPAHTRPGLQHRNLLRRGNKPVPKSYEHSKILKGGYDKDAQVSYAARSRLSNKA